MNMKLILPFVLLSLSGCAVMSESECKVADWRSVGYQDGVAGRMPAHLSTYAEACVKHGITPDRQMWEVGRQSGLQQYCTKDNAYRIGQSGQNLSPVCTPDTQKSLARAHKEGMRYHQINHQLATKRQAVTKLQNELKKLFDSQASVKDVKYEIAYKQKEIAQLEKEIKSLTRKLQAFKPSY